MTGPRPIAVFGGLTIDRLATTAAALVPGASNPGTMTTRAGGVGMNLATILAALGHPVRLVARVGDDDDGRRAVAAAAAHGIDTDGVSVSASQPTASYTAVFDETGELHVGVADMAVYEELRPDADTRLGDPPTRGEVFVADANLPAATLAWLAARARQSGHPFAALTVSPAKAPRLAGALDRVDWLFANRAEAAALLAHDPRAPLPAAAGLAADLKALGPRGIVVTDRGATVVVADGGAVSSLTPPAVEVVQVNGAGDSLAAGTLHALAAGKDLAEAIHSGLGAAAMTLEHGGIAEAMFSADRLAAMADIVRRRPA